VCEWDCSQFPLATRALALNADGEAELAVSARTLVRQQGSGVIPQSSCDVQGDRPFPPHSVPLCDRIDRGTSTLATVRESLCVVSVDTIVECS